MAGLLKFVTPILQVCRINPLAAFPRSLHPRSLTSNASGGVDIDAVQIAEKPEIDVRAWNPKADHPNKLSTAQLLLLIDAGRLRLHQLEDELGDATRAVEVRREYIARSLARNNVGSAEEPATANLPYRSFDEHAFYKSIQGTNCEAVIGYVPVPVGVVGPLVVDGKSFRIPMATTEGALVASTNRGCRAIELSGGASSVIMGVGMTRAPLLRGPSLVRAAALKKWIETPENAVQLAAAFNSTTRFGKLRNVKVYVAGRNAFVRFACFTGDAMGMNMVTKGSTAAMELIQREFPDFDLVSMSGNVCADKKSAAINWIEGRGRSVACEVLLKKDVIHNTLKTTAKRMANVNRDKNLVGSAVAGAMGGFNAHAANIVAAMYLATGNDIAQTVESSSCLTLLEADGEDLHVSVTMPSVEVGTVGGGTSLAAQRACLQIVGCAGAHPVTPGLNADTFARVVAGTVLSGEISLLAALASGDLLKSHMALNRKKDGKH